MMTPFTPSLSVADSMPPILLPPPTWQCHVAVIGPRLWRLPILASLSAQAISSQVGLLALGVQDLFDRLRKQEERSRQEGKSCPPARFILHLDDLFATGSVEDIKSMFLHLRPNGVDMWADRSKCLLDVVTLLFDAGRRHDAKNSIDDFADLFSLTRILAALKTAEDRKVQRFVHFFLESLPGFSWDKVEKGLPQGQTVMDQFGYLSMQWSATLVDLKRLTATWTQRGGERDMTLPWRQGAALISPIDLAARLPTHDALAKVSAITLKRHLWKLAEENHQIDHTAIAVVDGLYGEAFDRSVLDLATAVGLGLVIGCDKAEGIGDRCYVRVTPLGIRVGE